jgi:hypothetical protein
MADRTSAGVTEGWLAYLRGLPALALPGDVPPGTGAPPGEAVLVGAAAWASQGPWASGLFRKEPTRVLVITGSGGADSDFSRAIAAGLAGGFLQGEPAVPLPLRVTVRGRGQDNARDLMRRHLGQAGLTIADWRYLRVPTLVTVDGLDDLLPPGGTLPAREELGLLSELCSHELSQSRLVIVTSRQPDSTRQWQLIMDRLDEGTGLITLLDAAARPQAGLPADAGSRAAARAARPGARGQQAGDRARRRM